MSQPAAPLEHFDVQLDDVRLHVVASGPEDGPLVLFLHGFPEYWRSFHHQIDHFASRGYRVLAPDQRGYGSSDKPRAVSAYRPSKLARDVLGLIDYAGRERATVVGHDWGAIVTWWAAMVAPERIKAAAVLNVPHPAVMRRHLLTNLRQIRRSWYIGFFQLPLLPEWSLRRNDLDSLQRSLRSTSRRGTFSDQAMAGYREAWSQPGAIRGMLAWYRAALRYPALAVPSPRISPPTLILWGLRDRFLGREMIQPSLELCERGRVETFEQATHWLQHEEPDGVNSHLEQFFEET